MISRHILSLLSRTGAVLGDVARLVALVADGLLSALRGLVTVLVALVALNVTGAVSSDVTTRSGWGEETYPVAPQRRHLFSLVHSLAMWPNSPQL